MVWVKQIDHALGWLKAFFVHNHAGVSRTFRLADYRREGEELTIGTDASPARFGGWLASNGKVIAYFSDKISANDESILKRNSTSSEGQQAWEFLAILVALRLWLQPHRQNQFKIVGDNTGALSRSLKLRPKCRTMAIIAREIAFSLSHLSFPPTMVHTPGVAHVLADSLSRSDPDEDSSLKNHPTLRGAKRDVPASRDRQWYQTLAKFRG